HSDAHRVLCGQRQESAAVARASAVGILGPAGPVRSPGRDICDREAPAGPPSGGTLVVTLTLGSMSSRHLLPGSTAKRVPEHVYSWMPETSPGMTDVFVLSELHTREVALRAHAASARIATAEGSGCPCRTRPARRTAPAAGREIWSAGR